MSQVSRLKQFQNGTKALPEDVNAEFDNLISGHNDTDSKIQGFFNYGYAKAQIDSFLAGKTDLNGNHLGLWQGMQPSDFSAGQQAQKIKDLEILFWMGAI